MQSVGRFFFRSFTCSNIGCVRASFVLAARQYSQPLCPADGPAKDVSRVRRERTRKKDLASILKVDEPEKLAEFLLHHGLPPAQVAKILESLQAKRFAKVHSDRIICLIRYFQSMDMAADKIAFLLMRATFLFVNDLDTHLLPKFRLLENLGLDERDSCALLLRYPYCLYGNVESLQAQIDFLRNLCWNNEGLCTIIKKNPSVLRARTERHLQPRLDFVQSLGIDKSVVRTIFLKSPRIFARSTDKISRAADILEELGFKRGTSAFSRAFGCVARHSSDSIKLAVRNFLELGFSQDQFHLLVQRHPSVLGKGAEDLSKKIRFLVEVLKRPLNDVVKFPAFLSISFEGRILPRHEALVKWKAENRIEKEYSLSYIYAPSKEAFCEQFPGCKLSGP